MTFNGNRIRQQSLETIARLELLIESPTCDRYTRSRLQEANAAIRTLLDYSKVLEVKLDDINIKQILEKRSKSHEHV